MNDKSNNGTNRSGVNIDTKGSGEEQAAKPRPIWDKSNSSESLRRIGCWLNDEARRMFLKNATHSELLFLYKEDGQGTMTEPTRNMDRDTFSKAFKDYIRQNEIYGVVHIVEAWMYVPCSLEDRTSKQVLDGENKIPGQKTEERAEILFVNYECRDGTQNTWLNPILRTKDGGVALQGPVEIGEKLEGRFGCLF